METPFVQISKIISIGFRRLEGSILVLVSRSVWVGGSEEPRWLPYMAP